MVCLFAILLYTGTRLSQKDRFIITTPEYRYPSYGNYEVNYDQPFPVPGLNSGIYRTLVDIDGPGTYVTVYCSNRVSIKDLWRFVSNGLTSLQGRLDAGFSNDEWEENNCLNHVNNLYRKQVKDAASGGVEVAGTKPLPVSDLIKSHHCTKRLLISLVYQQRILSVHWQGFITTYSNTLFPSVKFDLPLEIVDAVLHGQFLMHKIEGAREEALAWNQGQLQLFKRESFLHSWVEATRVGYEPYTGRTIAQFIQSNNAQVKSFIKKFTRQETESCEPHYFGIRDKASHGLEVMRAYRLNKIPGKVKRLVPIPADGNLYGIKICQPTEWPEEDFSNDKLHEFLAKLEVPAQ